MNKISEIEIDYINRKVFLPNHLDGHSKKISLDFNDIGSSKSLNHIDSSTAYTLGSMISSFNLGKMQNINLNYRFKLYQFFCIAYIMFMIVSNILSLKLVSIYGFTVTGAFLIYPFTYILNFIISDVYGYKNARRCIHYVIGSLIVFILVISILVYAPPSKYWHHQKALEEIFILQIRVFFASLIAFAVSIFVSSYLIQKIKIITKNRYLFIRIMMSLLVSEMLDTFIFCIVAFAGVWEINAMIKFLILSYCIKLLYEAILYPFVTKPLINKVKKIEKLDVIDIDTKFNPFSMDINYDSQNNLYK
jgi:uncharacterized integral membrane protein (TIGR00697 family)